MGLIIPHRGWVLSLNGRQFDNPVGKCAGEGDLEVKGAAEVLRAVAEGAIVDPLSEG